MSLTTDDPDIGLESPVTGQRLDFFDTGVWVEHDEGRDFFPDGRVQVVREREAEE